MFRQALLLLILTAMAQTSLANPVSGQLAGDLSQSRKYLANTEITEFNPDGTLQGFFHDNGRLRAQEPGLYYIYAQVFFENYADAPLYHNRVVLSVNHVPFSQMQTGLGGQADFGSKYTGGVIRLQQGDYIHLLTYYDSFLWVSKAHTFFGAFKIGE